MRGRDLLVAAEMSTHAHRYRFLTDAEVGGAAHFLVGVQVPDALLDHPDAHDAV
jgi:hypothetical protein